MNAQHDFLRGEFRTLSFMGASQHVSIYAKHADERDRAAFRAALYARLETLEPAYAKTEVPEDEHVANIVGMADTLSASFTDTLHERRFRIGPAQKALNLYLKYLWCAGLIPRPPHCPVDAIVLQEAGRTDIRWSWMDHIDEYQTAISTLRDAAGDQPLADWELTAWKRGQAKNLPTSITTCSVGAPHSARHGDTRAFAQRIPSASSARTIPIAAFGALAILGISALCADPVSAQSRSNYEHMEYGISTAQRLDVARDALRDETFPELNVSTNTESFIAIDMACEKYPKGPVRQTCTDAGKVRHFDKYEAAPAPAHIGAPRSIAEQAREIQAAAARKEAIAAEKEARKERVRAATATLSGWDEHDAYKQCMKERDHSEASHPTPRSDIRDRRVPEPEIPPPDVAEACAADAKQRVAEEKERDAVERAAAKTAAEERQRAREACRNSDAARLAEASRFLVINRDLLKIAIPEAQEQLERDKDVERLTGVANLKLRHEAGDLIVNGPKQLAVQFDEYRSLGGTASSIDEVKGIPDPCRNLP